MTSALARAAWGLGALACALACALSGGACHRDIRLLPVAAGTAGSDGGGTDGGTTGGTGGNKGGAGGHGGTSGSAGGRGGSAGAPDGGPGTCTGLGDPIQLPTASGPACASALATRGHRFALCSCDLMTVPARIRTDAFDSAGAGGQDEVSAAVGVNGALQSTAELRAGGAITVSGAVLAAGHLQSARSLRVGGGLAMLSSNADVAGDAFVGGDVSGSVRVNGTLHVPAAAIVGGDTQTGAIAREAVTVAPPCDCGAGFANIAAAIAAAPAASLDAAAGFSPGALASVSTPARLELGCGTYTLDDIDAQAAVTLVVHGRAVLAVAGDVVVRAGLVVTLDPAAELDLLVGGRLTASGAGTTLGTVAAPARFRIWIAGTSSVLLDDWPTLGAVVHAPGAVIAAPAGIELYGSLLARGMTFGADSSVHFDRAVFTAGAACGEPAATAPP